MSVLGELNKQVNRLGFCTATDFLDSRVSVFMQPA